VTVSSSNFVVAKPIPQIMNTPQAERRSGPGPAFAPKRDPLAQAVAGRRTGVMAMQIMSETSEPEATRGSLSGHSLQLRPDAVRTGFSFERKLWCRRQARPKSANDPTAPSALPDPGLVLVRAGSPGPLG
jgi:hypothetical protein